MRIKSGLLLFAFALTLTSCWDVDNVGPNKPVIDPNESLVDTDEDSFDFEVPDDFDWENFRVVKSKVTIYNRYDYNVEYGVVIYDGEDVIDAGITKNGVYTSSFAARRSASRLSVMQRDPSGDSASVYVSLSGSDLNCDFNTRFAKSTGTIGMATRSDATYSAPDVPAGAIEMTNGMELAENGVYYISAGSVINNVDLGKASGVQVYILEGGEFTTIGGGSKVLLNGSIFNAGTFSVGEGSGELLLLDDSIFENYGELKVGRLGLFKGVVLKNCGTVEISNDVWTQTQSFKLFENRGDFVAKGQIQLTGGDKVDNYHRIESETRLNIHGIGEMVLNPGSMIKAPEMDIQRSSIISKGDAIIRIEDRLNVDYTTTFVGDETKPSIICGEEGKTKIWFSNTSNVNDKWVIDPNPDIWGANWGDDVVLGNPGYVIEATPGNGGGFNADKDDEKPDNLEDIDFATTPKLVIFEDRYPRIDGILDFNDIVMQWNLRGKKDANDIVKDLYLDVTVKSCGAGRKVGAGVRIHSLTSNVLSATIEADDLSKHYFGYYFTPGNGVEADKNGVVVPLFESIHSIFGLEQGNFINVSNNDSERSEYYKFTVKLELDNDLKSEDLKLENFDFFIVTGVNDNGRTEIHTFGNDVSLSANNEITFKNPSAVWGLELPKEFLYPTEQKAITAAYPSFRSWIESAGTSDIDWYEYPVTDNVVANN